MKARVGLMLSLYRAGTAVLAPGAATFLRGRLRRGKEDAERLGERSGHAGQPRPPGSLAWVHGASVGEGLALLPLIDRLVARGLAVLVTTGTVTSARILAGRLPGGAVHQFLPLDVPGFMRRFLDHWRPDLVILAESELWPNLILEVSGRGIPLVLANARMSSRSFRRWGRVPGIIRALLGRLDLCMAQGEADAARFAALGADPVLTTGNLKFDVPPPPADRAMVGDLAGRLAGRPVWVAASTHAGEEPLVLAVHGRVALQFPDLITIAVPRRAQDGDAYAAEADRLGLAAVRRSKGERIDPGTQIYIADTMGEIGLFYRLADVVFMGKSLAGGGGQNPIEPAKLGSAILHGPNVGNFPDVYRTLDEAGGAAAVAGEGQSTTAG